MPAGLHARGAAGVGGEQERERGGAAVRAGLGGEMQPAHGGEVRRGGEADRDQRHHAAAQRLLGGGEQFGGGAGRPEDQPSGVEVGQHPVPVELLGVPPRLEPEDRPARRPPCQQREKHARRARRLMRPGPRECEPGGEAERVGGGGVTGLEHGGR